MMINKMSNVRNVALGVLIGSLAGAAAMMLFAPQSGQRTRAQIQVKGIQLRDRTSRIVNKEIEQVRFDAHKIMGNVQDKAGQIKQIGQDKLVQQLDHVSGVLDAGKTALEAV
jgi:gas vesicle protein